MKQLLAERQIEWLVHFTQADNLPNIMQYGLLPRTVLDEQNIHSFYNDDYRYDDCLNAICMSIEFPNYKMFYKLRQDNPQTDWVVLFLKADILCDFPCAFCYTNAGNAAMYSTPIEQRMGKNAFLRLFDDPPNGPTRKELNIGDWYPTNPQAEVLVFGTIPTEYISKIYFQSNQTMKNYIKFIPDFIQPKVSDQAFKYRNDWSFWQ